MRYRLRNGSYAQVDCDSVGDCLDSETGKPKTIKLAWGKDSRGNAMAWDAVTGTHHVGGHVPPASKEYDIVAPADL